MKAMSPKANSLLRSWTGPLTEELVQEPARFGLGRLPARLVPDDTASMTCGFCSTGCALNIHIKGGQAINLTPDADYPVNLGMACPKGWEALEPLRASDRATTPLLRDSSGAFQAVDWDTAMQVFTLRLQAIQEQFGPESIAWLGSGQIVTEELAFLGALAKFGMGMLHGDGNTRQCMATSVVAYKEAFGFDAPPYTYQDFEESDVLVFIGSNLCIAHPILWQRVLRNPHHPQIIVIDPRKTESAMAATQHYAIKPKSDLVLLYGIARSMIENGWADHRFIGEHTTGFESFERFLIDGDFALASVSVATGISVEHLNRLARTIGQGKRVSFWWTMGVNQGHEATRTAQAIINLALLTGNIGRPGTGANSITGQCNAMGSRLYSNTTNLLGGHEFGNAVHREKIARILGIGPERIPQTDSWAYDQIVEGIDRGQIKGLWIIGTNTAHSWIGQRALAQTFGNLDFLVVQDMYATTETAKQAHLVLPAAGWGEKEGTFINSERRIGMVKKVARTPGHALSDFNIFKLVAHYWGCGELFRRWTSPEAVFQIIKEISRGQPCDITGIKDYRMIDESGGIQWPWPQAQGGKATETEHRLANTDCQRRLFENGKFYTPNGKARIVFEMPREMPEMVCAEYPFLLLTGRGTSAQWHTQTRTGKSELLRQLGPVGVYVEVNPDDAAKLGITHRELVQVLSRRGQIQARVSLTATVQPGQVFIPMHYRETNELTLPSFDPYSRQPSYKACAVKIVK